MKRVFTCLFIAILFSLLVISASDVAIGTVVNHTLYTDIVAEIDGHPLRSYNVDNHTVIIAEDLQAYGFHVIWHAEERWLEVVRPVKNGEPLTPSAYPDYMPSAASGKIGTPAHDILYTDIVTTVAGDRIDSWNINGETVIPFRELERYGQVLYDNETRRSMYITEPYKVFAGGHWVEQQQPVRQWDAKAQTTDSGMTITLTVGEDSDSFSSFFGRDKSDVNMDLIWNMETNPVAKVTLAFYPERFRTQKTLRHSLYETLSGLQIPSMMDTIDGTNTPEVRAAVAHLRITLNGKTVNGDLFKSQGNGHEDFTFLFDKGFTVKAGDVVSITASTG